MTTVREFPVAAALPNGEVLVAGGANATGIALASAELFESAPEAAAAGGDFGEQTIADRSIAAPLIVTNVGAQALTIARASIGGINPGEFAITADACAGRTLAFDHSCTVTVRFTPVAAGARSAAIILQDNEPTAGSIALSGTGVTPRSGPVGPTGPAGLAGPRGPTGSPGLNGSAGTPGAQGPRGPAGGRGPAGRVRLVTCRTVTRTVRRHGKQHRVTRRKCTTKVISGGASFTTTRADAMLTRGNVLYATGSAWHGRLVLHARRTVRRGHYVLTLRWRDGPRTIAVRRRLTVR
jgi:hypothetical protein